MDTTSRLPLPPARIRFSGTHYLNDEDYIRSGLEHALMLEAECGLSRASHVLDLGCGQGRFLIGLVNRFGAVARYAGVDVHESSILWLQQNLQPLVPNSEFHWLDYPNERYNPDSRASSDVISLNLPGKFDCVTLFSVFSHMRLRQIEVLFGFINQMLRGAGRVFATAFVEDNVELEAENPAGYRQSWRRPLHCVRLNREHFEQIALVFGGLRVERFRYGDFLDGQSSYVFAPAR